MFDPATNDGDLIGMLARHVDDDRFSHAHVSVSVAAAERVGDTSPPLDVLTPPAREPNGVPDEPNAFPCLQRNTPLPRRSA